MRLLFFGLVPVVVLWCVAVGTMPMEPGSAFAALAIVVVPVSLVALGSSRAAAEQWAAERGAQFAPAGVDQLRRHLGRTRVARTVGVTVGFAIPLMLTSRYNADPDSFRWFLQHNGQLNGWWLVGLGYMVGSVWAEAMKPRDGLGDGGGAAVLSRRRLGDYLDANVQFVLGVFILWAIACVGLWSLAPIADRAGTGEFPWVGIAGSLGVAGTALGAAAWTCRRRELVGDDAALAYEELTRTATLNALSGVAVAMLGAFSGAMLGAPRDDSQISGWFQLPGAFAGLLGLGYWVSCGTKLVFRTRRLDSLRAAAT